MYERSDIGRRCLPLAVGLVAVAATCLADGWRERFPYVHDDVPFRHAYERVRVEERAWSFIDVVKDIRYLTKMRRMMPRSSTQIEAYFARRNADGPAALDPTAHYDLVPDGGPCRLGALGDVMYVTHGTNDFLRPPLADRLAVCDLVMANLETPVVPDEPPGMIHQFGLRFNTDPALLDTLATGGAAAGPTVAADGPLVDVLALANNHALDRGVGGLERTMFEVGARGIRTVGVATADDADEMAGRYVVLERSGLRVAVVAVGWGLNRGIVDGPPPARLSLMPLGDRTGLPDFGLFERIVAAARRDGAELVVLTVHWGYEFEYYPEPHFMRLAREFAARGADVIVGHGPHVVQPVEVLHVNMPAFVATDHYVVDTTDPRPRTCLVAYSLGNVTTLMGSEPCKVGALLTVDAARAVERVTGRHTVVLTDGRLSFFYAERHAAGPSTKHVALFDAAWALSSACDDAGLTRRVHRALEVAAVDRLGSSWLAASASPASPQLRTACYECPAAVTVRIDGVLTPTAGSTSTAAVLQILSYEAVGEAPLTPALVRRLGRGDAVIPVVVPGGAGPRRVVTGLLDCGSDRFRPAP